jgi:NAD(P)-dependent dehydrogenase (short-subunit alcohol dehydrogenase family)
MPDRRGDWDLEAMPDISGRTVIVTGAASGLGAQITKVLSSKGGQVVMADVDVAKANTVAESIRSSIPGATPEVIELDLADIRSVKRFIDSFRSKHGSLDILVNNAGIMVLPYSKTVQGYESQWGVNYLGHFFLTANLLDLLMLTKDSRVVIQTSIVHRGGAINFDDINWERHYSPWKAYKQSKLATLLFSQELQRRLDLHDIESPHCVACHPGLVDTSLYGHRKLMRLGLKPFMHDIFQGSLPALRACLDPAVKGGEFYGPDGWMQFKGHPVLVEPQKRGRDLALAKLVWELSEKMTGIGFSALLEAASMKMD